MTVPRFIGRALLGAVMTCAAGTLSLAQDQPAPPPPENNGPGEGDRPRDGDRPGGGERRGRGERRGGPRRPGQMLARMKAAVGELQLTDEQKSKMDAILADASAQFEKLRTETEGKAPRERMEAFRPVLQSLREQVAAALTEEQRQALRSKVAPPRGPGRGGNPVERIRRSLADLELTAEQQGKVDALLKETEQKIAALRAETQTDGEQARGKIRELMRQNFQKFREILTPEQQEKLRNRRQGPRGGRPGGERRPPPADEPL